MLESGTHAASAMPPKMPENSAGATPITVKAWRLMVTMRPTTLGSALKRSRHKRIGEHDFIHRAVGAIVCVGLEEAANLRLQSKQLKVVGRDGAGRDGLRLRIRQCEVERS